MYQNYYEINQRQQKKKIRKTFPQVSSLRHLATVAPFRACNPVISFYLYLYWFVMII